MKYLASIEGYPYHFWQIEILIESFKMQNMEDDLIIAVAVKDKEMTVRRNFSKHPHIFYHVNQREEVGPYFNKPYAAIAALENKLLVDDFVLLDPDMILIQPMQPIKDANIVYSTDSFYTEELLDKEGYSPKEFVDEIMLEKAMELNFNWPYPGGVYQFHHVDEEFFKRIIYWGNKMKNKNDPLANRYASKAAWILTLWEFYDSYNIVPQSNECTMVDFNLFGNFIHYYHGLPPFFNKKMFPMDDRGSLFDKTPYEVMVEHNPNLTTDYVQKVIHSMNR